MTRWLWQSFVFGLLVAALSAAVADDKKPTGTKDEVLKLFSDEFVALEPGKAKFPESFLMGSTDGNAAEKPAHKVTLKKPFAIAKYEVTQELYQAVMGNEPSRWKGPRNSVEMVTWTEAVSFCEKATKELRERKLLKEGELIRLPSEAEWEYACRAGTTTAYSFGDKASELGPYAWFKDNSKGYDPPVGKKQGNPWGLYDLHGYIWEWVQDSWHDNYDKAPADGSAWEEKDAKERVIRGGSWGDDADSCRSAFRTKRKVDYKDDRVGFRCVRAKQ